MDNNPFVIGADIPIELFCDREAEVELLQKHIANGRNVVLSSPRRLGKSGLIHHLFKQPKIKKNYAMNIIRIGSPIALQDFLVGISFLVMLAIVNSIGVTESAGVGVAEKVCAFIMLVPAAFALANKFCFLVQYVHCASP